MVLLPKALNQYGREVQGVVFSWGEGGLNISGCSCDEARRIGDMLDADEAGEGGPHSRHTISCSELRMSPCFKWVSGWRVSLFQRWPVVDGGMDP